MDDSDILWISTSEVTYHERVSDSERVSGYVTSWVDIHNMSLSSMGWSHYHIPNIELYVSLAEGFPAKFNMTSKFNYGSTVDLKLTFTNQIRPHLKKEKNAVYMVYGSCLIWLIISTCIYIVPCTVSLMINQLS